MLILVKMRSVFLRWPLSFQTHVLAEVLLLPQGEFLPSWCSTGFQLMEEDATLEYDPFVAAGAVLISLPVGFGTSIPLNDTKTECNFNVISVPQVSYSQHKTSLLVKIFANLHCFVPDVCKGKALFLNFANSIRKVCPFYQGSFVIVH